MIPLRESVKHFCSLFTGGGKQITKKTEVETKKKKIPKEPGIKEGQPLPDTGTCKHYKKSHRWLR